MERGIFLVYFPGGPIENVIVEALGRESAKIQAKIILPGNPDHFVVSPITLQSSRTVFLLGGRATGT